MVLSYISLAISHVEHIFRFLLVIYMSSLAKWLFRSSALFLIGWLGCCDLSCMSCLYGWSLTLRWFCRLQMFSPVQWVLLMVLYCVKAFN